MTRRFSVVLLALSLMLVTFSPAFASPMAFNGGATSQSLDLALDLSLAEISIDIGSMEAVQSFDDVNPATTSGAGEGINLAVTVGDPGDLPLDLINVSSSHTLGDGPDADTDSDSLTSIDNDLLDVEALSMDTSSLATATTVNTNMNWSLAGLVVHGDVLGVTDLVTTDAITGTSDTDLDGDGNLLSVGHTQVDGLVLEVPLGITTIELVSADVISTTASAGSDGSAGGATAYANTEFVNLRVQGEDVSTSEAGTVIDLEALGINIGSVTIRPVEETFVSDTQSSAQAVALRIEILEVLGLIGANIDVGTTTAQAGVQPGFPTAVTVTDMHLTTGDNLPYAFLALGILGGLMGMVKFARRHQQ